MGRPQSSDDVQAMVEAIDATLANHGYSATVTEGEIATGRDSFDLNEQGMLDPDTEAALEVALGAKKVFSTPVGRIEAWY